MSQKLISHSPDLKRLQDQGYSIEVRSGYLLLSLVPYVTKTREIKLGTLISTLTLAGNITAKPDNHVVLFAGETPCDQEGLQLGKIINSSRRRELGNGLIADHRFSHKPEDGYRDYYEKMTTYANILSEYAQKIDPSVSTQSFGVVEAQDEDSVFKYMDTASSRAEIVAITKRLASGSVAIVGLGGTGSYILDLVAKTPVKEVHLFDGDQFYQHNAFRAPGAPSIQDLNAKPLKAEYFADIYSKMRHNIFVHGYVDDGSAHELRNMDFVFVAVDRGPERKFVIQKLVEFGISFVDAGMSIYEAEDSLLGTLRVTASTPDERGHITPMIPQVDDDGEDEYSTNIQIADLNSLNAVMAVIKWKKLIGFYQDRQKHHSSFYAVDVNEMTNDNQL